MDNKLDSLVKQVTEQVLRALAERGDSPAASCTQHKSERADMSKYKSPLLAEAQVLALHELTKEVIVPPGTVVTPKARQLARQKGIIISVQEPSTN